MMSGARKNNSAPGRRRLRNASGSRRQPHAPPRVTSGRQTAIRKTAGTMSATNGASHRPAKKPSTTLGSAAMTSTDGLTTLRSAGCMNCEV